MTTLLSQALIKPLVKVLAKVHQNRQGLARSFSCYSWRWSFRLSRIIYKHWFNISFLPAWLSEILIILSLVVVEQSRRAWLRPSAEAGLLASWPWDENPPSPPIFLPSSLLSSLSCAKSWSQTLSTTMCRPCTWFVYLLVDWTNSRYIQSARLLEWQNVKLIRLEQ